jgi:peptidoglycan/LPS O-acetylase OafA/YrhL
MQKQPHRASAGPSICGSRVDQTGDASRCLRMARLLITNCPIQDEASGGMAAQNIPTLTGIRAVAAGMVLLLHAELQLPAQLTAVLPFVNRGYLGVDLFFILSGYIITHIYLESFARSKRDAVRVFLWHRLVRLYPVHVTVLAALVGMVVVANLAGIPLRSPRSWHAGELAWQLSLLHGWGLTNVSAWNAPSWSVSAEAFAYLLFPFIALGLLRTRNVPVLLILACVSLAVMAAAFVWQDRSLADWTHGRALIRVAAEFLCGAALCRAVMVGAAQPLKGRGDLFGIAAFVLFILGASTGASDFTLVALLALTIVGAATASGPLAAILANRPMVWLGEISYSVYMVHLPVLIVLRHAFVGIGFPGWPQAGRLAGLAVAIAIVVAGAAMLYNLVERPARTRLRDWAGVIGARYARQ